MPSRSLGARLRAVTTVVVAGTLFATAQAHAGTISGTVFQDANRNGTLDVGEMPMSGRGVQLLTADRSAGLAYTASDAGGRYTFTGVLDGSYVVGFDRSDWSAIRQSLAPTTTPTLVPDVPVTVTSSATADFGWRPIVRSSDLSAPISSYTGPTGLKVASYDDVVTARTVHDAVLAGSLVGAEAARTAIRFDFPGEPNVTYSTWNGGQGGYTNFRADVEVAYVSWLDGGDQVLFHEYGHAWSLYHALMVQQDSQFTSYLQARGLTGHPKLDSSHAWNRQELIAEDYRQLFGTANARALRQENTEIPAAAEVAGLRAFLSGAFLTAPGGSVEPAPDPAPEPAPTPALTITGLTMNPAPVKTTGTASFTLSAAGTVTVTVKDGAGRTVRTLIAGAPRPAGTVSAVWDRKNASGGRVKSGTYTLAVAATDTSGASAAGSLSFKVS